MECYKKNLEIINLDKFNQFINKYNEEENGEFTGFLTKCPMTGGSMKGGAPGDTKLNKYFFTILRCLIFSIGTAEFFRNLIFRLPAQIIHELLIGFLKLLRLLLIGGCQIQIPIITDMCPMYKDLFIEFLNNMEIILIKLGPVMKNGITLWIHVISMKDFYNQAVSKKKTILDKPPLQEGGKSYVYHGTSEKNLKNISKEGLLPNNGVINFHKIDIWYRKTIIG